MSIYGIAVMELDIKNAIFTPHKEQHRKRKDQELQECSRHSA